MEETDFAPPHLRRLPCLLLRAPKFIFSNSSRDEFTKKSRENADVGRFWGKTNCGEFGKDLHSFSKGKYHHHQAKKCFYTIGNWAKWKKTLFPLHNGFSRPQRGIFAALFVLVSICPRGEVFSYAPNKTSLKCLLSLKRRDVRGEEEEREKNNLSLLLLHTQLTQTKRKPKGK